MTLQFEGEAIWWRGPAPFVFVPVPPDLSSEIKAVSAHLTYGWDVIPAVVRIGGTEYTTSLFPKDGIYLVPVKVRVQKAENVKVGDLVNVRLELAPGSK
ncbi:hypothetical protein BH11ARM2_BH11ARM2_35000 [soil metagenome]